MPLDHLLSNVQIYLLSRPGDYLSDEALRLVESLRSQGLRAGGEALDLREPARDERVDLRLGREHLRRRRVRVATGSGADLAELVRHTLWREPDDGGENDPHRRHFVGAHPVGDRCPRIEQGDGANCHPRGVPHGVEDQEECGDAGERRRLVLADPARELPPEDDGENESYAGPDEWRSKLER